MKVFMCLLFSVAVWAMSDNAFDEWERKITYFYLNPNESDFNAIQNPEFSLDSILKETNKVSLATSLARMSDKHGWPIKDSALGRVAKQILDKKSELARFVHDDQWVNPRKLDVWWGSYFATGDERYLENLFAYVAEGADDEKQAITNQAATWSFGANIRQHEAVKQFAIKKIGEGNLSKTKADFLQHCIDQPSFDDESHFHSTANQASTSEVGGLLNVINVIGQSFRLRSIRFKYRG